MLLLFIVCNHFEIMRSNSVLTESTNCWLLYTFLQCQIFLVPFIIIIIVFSSNAVVLVIIAIGSFAIGSSTIIDMERHGMHTQNFGNGPGIGILLHGIRPSCGDSVGTIDFGCQFRIWSPAFCVDVISGGAPTVDATATATAADKIAIQHPNLFPIFPRRNHLRHVLDIIVLRWEACFGGVG